MTYQGGHVIKTWIFACCFHVSFVDLDYSFLLVSNMGDMFIIAIDFGTAYSGYAFSIKGDANIDPIVPQWGLEYEVIIHALTVMI